jgi:kynurenine formamidase
MRFPGLGGAAAAWLVEHRRPRAIGIDVPSIDRARPLSSLDSLAAHDAILGADIPIFENVANLDRLPARGALVVASPMKIEGGTGAPVRIFAQIPG